MIETLHYGFEDFRMYVDVPTEVFATAMAENSHFEKVLTFQANQRVVNSELGEGGIRLLLNTKRAGNKTEDYIKEDRAKQMVYALAAVAGSTSKEQQDPRLMVDMSYQRLGDGTRLGMRAEVAWSDRSDRVVQWGATVAMRQTATDLKYCKPLSFIPELVYASVSRKHGVTLQTNPVGACDMGTDGMFYEPEEPVMELHHHNLYSHSMQLICLSGLIAIARA